MKQFNFVFLIFLASNTSHNLIGADAHTPLHGTTFGLATDDGILIRTPGDIRSVLQEELAGCNQQIKQCQEYAAWRDASKHDSELLYDAIMRRRLITQELAMLTDPNAFVEYTPAQRFCATLDPISKKLLALAGLALLKEYWSKEEECGIEMKRKDRD